MTARLKVIAGNPAAIRGQYLNGKELHWLAALLTEQVQTGNSSLAHTIAAQSKLSPLGIAVLATWMSRSGLSEDQILEVVACD